MDYQSTEYQLTRLGSHLGDLDLDSYMISEDLGLVTQLQRWCAVKELLVLSAMCRIIANCLFSASQSQLCYCFSWIPNINPVPLSRGQAHLYPRLSL